MSLAYSGAHLMALGPLYLVCDFVTVEASIGHAGGPPGCTSLSCKMSVVSRRPHGAKMYAPRVGPCEHIHASMLVLCMGLYNVFYNQLLDKSESNLF